MSESSSTQAARVTRRSVLKAFLFAVLAAAILLPIWIVPFPPLLDYPNHLASSFVLARLHDPNFDFGKDYSTEWGLRPYITTDFLMGQLGRVFPPLVAGKIVLSLGLLGLPLAAWFFLRQANPGQDAVAVWFLLAAYNLFFRYGFVGFCWSVALLFLTLGLWLRWLKSPTISGWTATLVALMAAYFTHLMGFLFAAVVMGLYAFTRPHWREWLWSACLFAPGVICYFVSSGVAEHQTQGATFRTLEDKVDSFWSILHGNSDLLDQISIAAIGVFFVAAWIWNREFKWQWRWLVVAGGLFLLFAALPAGYGEGYDIDIRVLPVLFVALFATEKLGRRGWQLAPLVLLLFAARTYDVTKSFRAAQPELTGMAQAFSMTPANARVLPIIAGQDEDPILQSYDHFWAYGVIERGWFSPYLEQSPGLLPLKLMSESYAPDGFFDMKYAEKLDWAQVRKDYDFVWAYDVPDFENDLKSMGDLIYTSGKLKFFRVRK